MRRLFLFACLAVLPALADPAPIVSTPPAPMDFKQNWDRYLYRTFSWQRMSLLTVDTGVDTLLGDVTWGRGMDGFACRYAHKFGRRLVGNTIEFGASVVLHEDTRYRPLQSGTKADRLTHAAKSAFLAYREDGRAQFATSRFMGYAGRAL